MRKAERCIGSSRAAVLATALAWSCSTLVAGCGGGDGDLFGNVAGGSTSNAAGATSGANGVSSSGGSSASEGSGGDSMANASNGSGGATNQPVSGSGGSVAPTDCEPLPACDDAPPDAGPELDWNHTGSAIIRLGAANHSGRDLFLNPGDPQWILARFVYGTPEQRLEDEYVDVYVQRNCSGPWELLGTTLTTKGDSVAPVEGVEDGGGRVFFPIPSGSELGIGRHRAHLIVRGDGTRADALIEIAAPGTPVFVSDVDGTLTDSENAEWGALFLGTQPGARSDASDALSALVHKGYHPFYLTARPEWLVNRTREFLRERGFPTGIVHTTLGPTGATGAAATSYKTAELARMAARSLLPAFAFGNTGTDATAYQNAGIEPVDHRIFFQFDDAAYGGRRIESYTDLLPEFGSLSANCL